MDKNTEEGYSPEYVAEYVLKAVLKQEKDVLISDFTPKMAIYLRTLCPSLYFWLMHKRAKKLKKEA